jgi:DNA-binding response OmpR family regulator
MTNATYDEGRVVILLIVEDDEAMAHVYDRVLGMEGFDVIIVHDLESARRAIGMRRPDVMLMDVSQSMANAIVFVRDVRARETLRRIPIGIMTADYTIHSRDESALKELAVHVFHKPLGLEHIAAIARTLARRGP